MAKVSKRLRFEIFRRDNHACRYCGRAAPEVALTIDHVTPDTLGGPTEPGNLVTACAECNGGKSSIAPDSPVVADVKEDALRWASAMAVAAQTYEAEFDHENDLDDVFKHAWDSWTYLGTKNNLPLPADWRSTIRRLRSAGLTDRLIVEAVETAMHASKVRDVFRYFCGVAWNMVGQLRERAAGILEVRPDPRPTGPSIENIIAESIDRVGAGNQLDPWVFDDLVCDAADHLRAEQLRRIFPDAFEGA